MSQQVYRVIARQENKKTVYSPVEVAELPEEYYEQVKEKTHECVHCVMVEDSLVIFSTNDQILLHFIYGLTFATTPWKQWEGMTEVFSFDYLA